MEANELSDVVASDREHEWRLRGAQQMHQDAEYLVVVVGEAGNVLSPKFLGPVHRRPVEVAARDLGLVHVERAHLGNVLAQRLRQRLDVLLEIGVAPLLALREVIEHAYAAGFDHLQVVGAFVEQVLEGEAARGTC